MALNQVKIICLTLVLICISGGKCDDLPEIELSQLPFEEVLSQKTSKDFNQTSYANKDIKQSALKLDIISSIPSMIKSGGKLNIKTLVTNSVGQVTYYFELEDQVLVYAGKEGDFELYIPRIKQCNEKLKLKISAEDQSKQTAVKEIWLPISQTWCTYRAQKNKLLSDNVTKLALGKNGRVWIGTDKGLNSLHEESWSTIEGLGFSQHFYENRKYVNALAVRFNQIVDEDEVFATTCESKNYNCVGVQRFFGEKVKSNFLQRYSSEFTSWLDSYQNLVNDNVAILAFAQDGKLLVGTMGSGVSTVDPENPQRPAAQLLKSQNIATILPHFLGVNLYGTQSGKIFSGKGLYWHSEKERTGFWLNKEFGGLFDRANILALAKDGNDLYVSFEHVWEGGGGLARIVFTGKVSPENGHLHAFDKKNHPNLSSNHIRQIVIGKKVRIKNGATVRHGSHVWLATDSGLNRFVSLKNGDNDGTFESAQFQSVSVKNSGGLVTDDINDLVYDAQTHTLWIATQGGGLTRLRTDLLE